MKKTTLYQGKVVNLSLEIFDLPNGIQEKLEIISHQGGAAILPIFENGDILLIRQFRAAINDYIWEIPAGKIEKGEDPDLTVGRELEEETGYRSSQIKKLTEIWTTPGFCREKIFLYVAHKLETGEKNLEQGECIENHRFSQDEIMTMIQDGKIPDAKTLTALLYYYSPSLK